MIVHLEDLDGPACSAGTGSVTRNLSEVTCEDCLKLVDTAEDGWVVR